MSELRWRLADDDGDQLPGMSDHPDQLTEVAAEITRAGGRVLGVLPLHLRPGAREHFLRWLAGHDRALHADYLRRYARTLPIGQLAG